MTTKFELGSRLFIAGDEFLLNARFSFNLRQMNCMESTLPIDKFGRNSSQMCQFNTLSILYVNWHVCLETLNLNVP